MSRKLKAHPEPNGPARAATNKAGPDEGAAGLKQLEEDPESFADVAKDNIVVKAAVGLFIVLAVIALLLVFAG